MERIINIRLSFKDLMEDTETPIALATISI